MSGSGESFFSAFALFFKASTTQIGVLSSLPPLLASFAQLLSAWLGRRFRNRKGIILTGASLQALMLLPLGLMPVIFPEYAIPLLILCAALFYAGSNLAVPQWNSLMGDLVPERKRGRYFARRTRLCTITSFSALIMAGIVLDLFDRNNYTIAGYLFIFLVAFGARVVSIYYLSKMIDPNHHVASLESPFNPEITRQMIGSDFIRFSSFFAFMQFSVAIASPFFIVYQLRDLQFTYLEYTISTSMSVLMQFIALIRWGRISDAFGNRLILVTTGSLIPFLPLMWTFSTNYPYILFVQAIGGMMWAGFSLSASNYLYDLIPSKKRATYMAFHNVVASVAVFIGAMIGGYLGTHLPDILSRLDLHFNWASALYGIFILSSVARLIAALVFLPHIKEIRDVKPMTVRGLIFRVARFSLSGMNFDIVGAIRSGRKKQK